jgi:streptogramin lyase
VRRYLPLLIPLLLLVGCGTRPRANPFDPNNPNTSGRPSGFVALAGDGQVRLRWDAVPPATQLLGYQVYRKGPNQGTYVAISPVLGIEVTTFLDPFLNNNQDYAYRLYFVFVSGLGSRPSEDVATPGTPIPWVIESNATDALRITADGRHVATTYGGFGGTYDVAVNVRNGHVWVSDPGAGRVQVINPQTGVRTTVPYANPGAIAVDSYDGTAWVCGLDELAHFREQGDAASLPIPNLASPLDAAVDLVDGSVWVCERGANRVRHYDGSGTLKSQSSVAAPTRVAVDSVTQIAWITSFTRGTVTRIDQAGAILDTLDLFVTPVGISIDAVHRRIWVADPGAGQIVALRASDGSVELRLPGFLDVGELSADPRTGEVWAVLADPGELVKVAPTGVVRRRTSGFHLPIAVSTDPGGH